KALAIYRDLATVLDKAGDSAGAADVLTKAVDLLKSRRKAAIASGGFTAQEVDAETAETYERLGKMRVKQKKIDAAVTAFRAAHQLYADPERADDPAAAARLEWNLSGAYAAKGKSAEALEHLEALLKFKPQAVEPYERFAALLEDVGRGAEVISSLLQLQADEGTRSPRPRGPRP